MSIDYSLIARHQSELLEQLEEEMEQDDDHFEQAHADLLAHFRNLAWLISCESSAQQRKTYASLLADGSGREQSLLNRFAAQA